MTDVKYILGNAVGPRTFLGRVWAWRCLIVAAWFAGCLGATASVMAAPARFFPACSRSLARLTPDRNWETHGPYWIAISDHTVASIETQTIGGRYTKNDVRKARCSIANNVAYMAMKAWENWSVNRGSVTASTSARSRASLGSTLGRFFCTGTTTGWDGAIESCRHVSNQHEGLIIVQFAISPT